MMGMEMMFKALGLDPEELMKTVNNTADMARVGLSNVQAQLNRIEANQVLMYQLMVKAGLIPTIEQYNGDVAKLDAPEKTDGDRIN